MTLQGALGHIRILSRESGATPKTDEMNSLVEQP